MKLARFGIAGPAARVQGSVPEAIARAEAARFWYGAECELARAPAGFGITFTGMGSIPTSAGKGSFQ